MTELHCLCTWRETCSHCAPVPSTHVVDPASYGKSVVFSLAEVKEKFGETYGECFKVADFFGVRAVL